VFAGFVVHAWTPPRWRLPLFLAISIAAFVVMLSPLQTAALIGIGCALVAICHMPLSWGTRVGLLLAAGAGLAAVRAEWILIPWKTIPTIVLPVLGAMFMFRLIVYMYDLRREKEPASIWQRLAYFFLLPNVVFLLFPVVDYKTFRRTYYDDSEAEIYQRGIRLVFRGVVQLLAYRLVYLYVVMPPQAVGDLGDVVRYTTSFWLLYMRVSGHFHMAIGILCLFGFNLPETNHLYYLTSSFTDLWRRANIYWKDFMQKVFYYSFYTRLKRFGTLPGVLMATMTIFVLSWLLHSYQWFWLRGVFPVRMVDMVFWGFIGVAVTITVRREMTRRAKAPGVGFSLGRATRRSAAILGMFLTMSFLWSFWSSPTISDWVDVLSVAANSSAWSYLVLIAALVAIVTTGVGIQYLIAHGWSWPSLTSMDPAPARAYVVLTSLALLILAQPGVQGRIWGPVAAVASSFGYSGQNQADEERETLGYYESLLETRLAPRTGRRDRPADWVTLEHTGAVQRTRDLRAVELIPDYEGTFKRATLRTNRWGFRDRDYELDKPPGTYRIAVLGASITMGSGIENDETFESIVERELNARHGFAGRERVEILNFSMAGYSVLQSMRVLDAKAMAFDPDMILCVVHLYEDAMVRRGLRAAIAQGRDLGYPWLEDVVRRSGARRGMSEVKIEQRLEPYMTEVVEGSMRTIARAAIGKGAVPVLVYVPLGNEDPVRWSGRREGLLEMAERAGFRVLSVEDAFRGRDAEALAVAPWDNHPNALAHRLIAERLLEALEREQGALELETAENSR
jgi:D-alanyl-lipoteichoic acid acyltransferase DltB (MBOAT superfamily)